jgi:hypothetical protein
VSAAALPELGPLLGKLIAAPAVASPEAAELDRIRLELLTGLFEAAAGARELLARGDAAGARAALGAPAWLGPWERAVAEATGLLQREAARRLREAAAASRYPARRLAAELPDEEDRRVLGARLSANGIALEEAVERLDDPARDWQESIRVVAGELEAAWGRLGAQAHDELTRADRRANAIAAWRRPWGPFLILAAVVLAGATWLGLVLGGYLTAPRWLRPVAEWLWSAT